jgi:Na+/phosphate symporter
MSKDTLTEKDKKLANLFVDMYKNVDKHTKEIANLEEQLYKQYQAMAIDKQEELDNTSKLFKKKRAKLEQEI